MNFREVCEKIKSGEIVFDTAGHVFHSHFIDHIMDHYERTLANSLGANDGKWENRANDNMDEVNARMREHYIFKLDTELENGSLYYSIDPLSCHGCGERLQWVLSGNVLMPREHLAPDSSQHIQHPLDYVCPYAEPRPIVGKINIGSRLIFANFFRDFEDAPEDVAYTNEWSLNYLIGRENITKHKAKQNVAYGQMTNTSVGIYVNDDKTSIIVGPAYHPAEFEDHASDEEYYEACKKPIFEGYKRIGEDICLDVWRWEATDLNTIGNGKYEAVVKDRKASGLVELDVPHGEWEFKHYFRCNDDDCENEHLYSRLDIITPA